MTEREKGFNKFFRRYDINPCNVLCKMSGYVHTLKMSLEIEDFDDCISYLEPRGAHLGFCGYYKDYDIANMFTYTEKDHLIEDYVLQTPYACRNADYLKKYVELRIEFFEKYLMDLKDWIDGSKGREL